MKGADKVINKEKPSTHALNDIHAARLSKESGIPQDVAEAHGWRTVSAEEAARLLGWTGPALPSGGVVMTYPGTDGFFRVRLDVPQVGPDGKKWKYLQPAGSEPRLFFPDLPVVSAALDDPAITMYITEGEKKALCAAVAGIPCAGIGGIWSWGKGGELIPDWSRVVLQGREFVLAGDSDLRGRPAADRAAKALPALAEKLYEAGAAAVKILYLPGPEYGKPGKVGLDDYLVAAGMVPDGLIELARKQEIYLPREPEAAKTWAVPQVQEIAARLAAREIEPADVMEQAAVPLGVLLAAEAAAAYEGAVARLVAADRSKTLKKTILTKIAQEKAREIRRDRRLGLGGVPEPEAPEAQTVSSVWPDAPGETHHLRCPSGFRWHREAVAVVRKHETDDGEVYETEVEICDPGFISAVLDSMDTSEQRYTITYRRSGQWVSEKVKPSELTGRKEFSAVLDRGFAVRDPEYISVMLQYMHRTLHENRDRVPVYRYTGTAGRRDGVIVYPGGVWGRDGPVVPAPIHYWDDRATPDFLRAVAPLPGGTADEARRVLGTLVRCAEPATAWAIAGWFAAALLAPLVRQAWGEFPILNIYGGKGSGKSSLIQAFYRAFFSIDSLGSARRPPFSVLKKFSCSWCWTSTVHAT